jgi:hypothetical protein
MLEREHTEPEHTEPEQAEGRHSRGSRRRFPAGTPRWHLCAEEDGQLTAVLTGSEPPVTVSGASLASLRRQIRNAMIRGLI